MSFVLDTNVISEWVKPRPAPQLVRWLDAQPETSLHLSVMTFAELRRGVGLLDAGRRRDALRRWIDGPLTQRFDGRILEVDRAVADAWGELMARAHRTGRGLHAVDALFAASALVHRLTLVTRNERDFAGLGVGLLNPFG